MTFHHIHTSLGLGYEFLGVIPRNSAYCNLASGLDLTMCSYLAPLSLSFIFGKSEL